MSYEQEAARIHDRVVVPDLSMYEMVKDIHACLKPQTNVNFIFDESREVLCDGALTDATDAELMADEYACTWFHATPDTLYVRKDWAMIQVSSAFEDGYKAAAGGGE